MPLQGEAAQEEDTRQTIHIGTCQEAMKIDGKFDKYSVMDREILIKIGLHISTILCADYNSTPAVPRNMTNYTRSELRINQAFCRAYRGRPLQFNAVLKPARHSIAWVKSDNWLWN